MRKETEENRRGKEAKAAVEPRVPSFRVEGVFMCAESGPGVSVSSVRFSFFFSFPRAKRSQNEGDNRKKWGIWSVVVRLRRQNQKKKKKQNAGR